MREGTIQKALPAIPFTRNGARRKGFLISEEHFRSPEIVPLFNQ